MKTYEQLQQELADQKKLTNKVRDQLTDALLECQRLYEENQRLKGERKKAA